MFRNHGEDRGGCKHDRAAGEAGRSGGGEARRARPRLRAAEPHSIRSRTVILAPAGPGRGGDPETGHSCSDSDGAGRRVTLRPPKDYLTGTGSNSDRKPGRSRSEGGHGGSWHHSSVDDQCENQSVQVKQHRDQRDYSKDRHRGSHREYERPRDSTRDSRHEGHHRDGGSRASLRSPSSSGHQYAPRTAQPWGTAGAVRHRERSFEDRSCQQHHRRPHSTHRSRAAPEAQGGRSESRSYSWGRCHSDSRSDSRRPPASEAAHGRNGRSSAETAYANKHTKQPADRTAYTRRDRRSASGAERSGSAGSARRRRAAGANELASGAKRRRHDAEAADSHSKRHRHNETARHGQHPAEGQESGRRHGPAARGADRASQPGVADPDPDDVPDPAGLWAHLPKSHRDGAGAEPTRREEERKEKRGEEERKEKRGEEHAKAKKKRRAEQSRDHRTRDKKRSGHSVAATPRPRMKEGSQQEDLGQEQTVAPLPQQDEAQQPQAVAAAAPLVDGEGHAPASEAATTGGNTAATAGHEEEACPSPELPTPELLLPLLQQQRQQQPQETLYAAAQPAEHPEWRPTTEGTAEAAGGAPEGAEVETRAEEEAPGAVPLPSPSGSPSASSSSHSSSSSSTCSSQGSGCSDCTGSFSEGGSSSSSSSTSSSCGRSGPRKRGHGRNSLRYAPGRGLSPPPGDFRAGRRGHPGHPGHPGHLGQPPPHMQQLLRAPPPGPGGPLPLDFRPPPLQRPGGCFPGYGPYPQPPPAVHGARPPPPFVAPGYGMPLYPVPYGLPPPPEFELGYGQLPRGSSLARQKGRGKGRGRKRRRERRSPRSPRVRRRMRCLAEPPPKVGDTWELSREQQGLRLVGELAPPGTQWEYRLRDESRRCFAGYMECPVGQDRLDIFFNNIKSGTQWSQPPGPYGVIPRKTAWMVVPGCLCTYRYGGIEVQPQVFPPWMQEIMSLYMPYCGLPDPADWPNSCNVNLYENGSQSVGWHADDEALFQGLHRDIRILSLSLGQRRKFDLKKNWPEDDERTMERLLLGNGCLCTMEGMIQKHYQHRVPKESEDLGPRINLTWRWILKHSKMCPRCS